MKGLQPRISRKNLYLPAVYRASHRYSCCANVALITANVGPRNHGNIIRTSLGLRYVVLCPSVLLQQISGSILIMGLSASTHYIAICGNIPKQGVPLVATNQNTPVRNFREPYCWNLQHKLWLRGLVRIRETNLLPRETNGRNSRYRGIARRHAGSGSAAVQLLFLDVPPRRLFVPKPRMSEP